MKLGHLTGVTALALLLGPLPASAQTATEIRAALEDEGMDREIRAFYTARGFRPLWLAGNGAAAEKLVEVLETADLDGLDSGDYRPRKLRSALENARLGEAEDKARAEALLSASFARYVRDLREVKRSPIEVTDPDLAQPSRDETEILKAAAAAPSLAAYVDAQGWAHPLYVQLRNALATVPERSDEARLLRANLARLRPLPSAERGRHVVVDIGGQRLMMYENGRLADSMKVIVGRPETPTPMMASTIRYATLNPYWNVPLDLVRDRIAPHVATNAAYLRKNGFEVLSDWSPKARPTDPELVDWQAVSSGQRLVRIRQRPGPGNGMGAVKFMFPNDKDIYLHDTPEKALFGRVQRQYSAGCIRLEDAARFGRWLYGKPLKPASRQPELRVDLPDPVPIYITYLTVWPEKARIATRPDSYGHDRRGK